MADISKISPDDGSTILNVKDRNAVHWSESKGYVGKNLIKNNATSQTKNGVTFTVNNDKSVSLSGTSTGNTLVTLYSLKGSVIKSWGNTLILSGGSQNAYFNIHKSDFSYNKQSWGEDKTIDTTVLEDNTEYKFSIGIDGTKNVNNMVIYPMLRLSSISDSTYEPYLTPNTDLMSYADNTVLGAKNLLNYPKTAQSGSGITFTTNADKSVSMSSGTASSECIYPDINGAITDISNFKANESYIYSYGKTYIENVRLQCFYKTTTVTTWTELFNELSNTVTFTMPANVTDIWFRISIAQDKTVIANTLYPMIRLTSDTDDTYVPYAMTNKELTERVKQIIKTGWNSEFTITVDGAGSGTTLALVVSVLGIGVIGFSGGKLNYATIWAASSQSITASEASATSIKLTTSSTTTVGLIPLSPISGKWSIT